MVRVFTLPISMTSHQRLAAATPLHPITALVLPMLCTRYAQMTVPCLPSSQVRNHYHLRVFWMRLRLKDTPTLKLYQVYDYFVESVGMGSFKTNLQRWLEIQGLIADAKHLALKVSRF